MKKFKIIYWKCGQKHTCEIEAESINQARCYFEIFISNDSIISIEEE